MKYVQINSFYNGSTGNIMRGFHEKLLEEGHDSYVFWGRRHETISEREQCCATNFGVYSHGIRARLTDRVGFYSKRDTAKLLAKLDAIDPDVVHLHNIHGYYINIEMLFRWLEKRSQSTVWTLHDCWSFTGHCSHFTYVKCEQWKSHCSHEYKCPQKGEYPKSYLFDSSKRNFDDKRRIFTSLPADKLTIVTPSQWLANLVGQSFLSKYPVEVRRNEIDRTVFKPTPSDFRERYGIGNRFMVLGVASPWSKRKGLDDFVRLGRELDDSYAVVLVGLSKRQIRQVSNDVVAIPRTESKSKLAEAYTAADLFVNPSIEETFGMTVAEAEACGTRSVVIDGSACTEAAEPDNLEKASPDFESLKATVKRCRGGAS